jgi:ribosomal protein S18 acetylase RimI-like enzyme
LTPDTVLDRLQSMSVLVAVSTTGEVAGTIASQVASGQEGHLRGMAVRPAWQGTGIADALLTAAERELLDRKCSRVTLDTTEPLQRAIRFYEKHGFRFSGRVGQFFGMPLFEYAKVLETAETTGAVRSQE